MRKDPGRFACSRLLVVAVLGISFLALPGTAATWNVSNVSELNDAVSQAGPTDEIVIDAGTYDLTMVLNMHTPNTTIRGATGVREDVILVGGGMNVQGVDEGISVGADDVTIRDLTLKGFYFNAVHIRAENDADRTLVSNVMTWNIGERHIKGSRDPGDIAKVSDDVVIEELYMLQTEPRTGHPDSNPDYIGGIDMMAVRNLVVRDSVAEGIVGEQEGGNAAVFLWQGVEDVLIERNVIIACAKGIALGNPMGPAPNVITGEWHADGGTIRNNFILRGPWTTGNNIGLELCSTRNIRACNNTIYSEDAGYFRTVSIYDCDSVLGLTTNVSLGCNLIRGRIKDYTDGSGWESVGNIVDRVGVTVTADCFVDVANGDFHLLESAVLAIDKGTSIVGVTDDIDGQARPYGSAPDIGADEYVPSSEAGPADGGRGRGCFGAGAGTPTRGRSAGIALPLILAASVIGLCRRRASRRPDHAGRP